MNRELLEDILSCPSLPSLPAVALRVIELTQDRDMGLAELARVIENDQALAVKVLRTVNSSFYGLRTKCSTINQALVMLGLSAVRSLALGFSLVSSLTTGAKDEFDHIAYWRRALYTGVAAKRIARAAGKRFEDEAFLGGLLQDVGMMAIVQVLGADYLKIIARTEGVHRRLARLELEALEIQHPDVGAMLARRWKLPDELVMPVKYHERPTAAPAEHADLVRCVALGVVAHDVLTDAEPRESLRRFYTQAEGWFGLTGARADGLLGQVSLGTRELSTLFRLETGPFADAEEVLRCAQERRAGLARAGSAAGFPPGIDALLIDSHRIDALTGLLGRDRFEALVRAAFDHAKRAKEPLAIVQIALDRYADIAGRSGSRGGDEALVGTAELISRHFGSIGAVAARAGEDAFTVALSGMGQVGAVRLAAQFRADLERAGASWGTGGGTGRAATGGCPLTASIGTAVIEPGNTGLFTRVEQLFAAAARAAGASRAAGGNCIRAFVPRLAA